MTDTFTINSSLLSASIADYAYQLIEACIVQTDEAPKHRLMELSGTYSWLLKELTRTEAQFFPNSYTRAVFVFDNYRVPQTTRQGLSRLRHWVITISRRQTSQFSESDFLFCAKALCQFVTHLSEVEPPVSLQSLLPKLTLPAQLLTFPQKSLHSLLSVVVTSKSNLYKDDNGQDCFLIKALRVENEQLINIELVGEEWTYLQRLSNRYMRINFTQMEEIETNIPNTPLAEALQNLSDKQTAEQTDSLAFSLDSTAQFAEEPDAESAYSATPFYRTTAETLVAIDPDALVDASVIANCRLRFKANPIYYLVNLFYRTDSNIHFLKGNIVNEYLDHHLLNQPTSAAEVFDNIIQQSPFYALLFNEEDKAKMLEEVRSHFMTIQNDFIQPYKQHQLSIEPTFLSEIFGLRGRLDVLAEYEHNDKRKDVIELKTGKDPKTFGLFIADKDAVQATCYNLLLDSVYNERTGTSAILYSASEPTENPLRNAPNDVSAKRSALKIRNHIAWFDYELTKNPERILNYIDLRHFENNGLWNDQFNQVKQLRQLIDGASPTEKAYFMEFVRFTAREHRTARVGSDSVHSNGGFAALWNQTLQEKEREYGILAYLRFVKTDMQGIYKMWHFEKSPDQTINISNFRTGDFVLLYPHDADGSLHPTHHQVVKATIRENTRERVVISPLNLFIDDTYFSRHTHWAVEPEINEVGFQAMYVGLRTFLQLPRPKRDLLLGLREPGFEAARPVQNKKLKPNQLTVLNRALASKDYFLLQGPPGTGKTKVMLRELVINLLKDPNERLVLLAYTNRAVDEICEALSEIESKPNFMRLGHSETTEYKDALLSQYAKNQSLADIKRRIYGSRIVVATTLMWQRNPELSARVAFTTAIIDEASQLLEPQIIGIIGQVNRFILIGDEKQLPAVVAQSDEGVQTQTPELNAIGINNLCTSMFERLLKTCQRNDWGLAYGMLKDQGRMHQDIESFPNKQYYDGQLTTLADWQRAGIGMTFKNMGGEWLPIMNHVRLLFIDTPLEKTRNINTTEAQVIASIIEEVCETAEKNNEMDSNLLGVITPYRSQIAEIRRRLPEKWQDKVSIDTVERYQGSQRRIILISMAVNNVHQLKRLHVLSDDGVVDKKLNVALTRAKEHLVIVGNQSILRQSSIYQDLIEHYREKGAVISFE